MTGFARIESYKERGTESQIVPANNLIFISVQFQFQNEPNQN